VSATLCVRDRRRATQWMAAYCTFWLRWCLCSSKGEVAERKACKADC